LEKHGLFSVIFKFFFSPAFVTKTDCGQGCSTPQRFFLDKQTSPRYNNFNYFI